MLDDFTPIIHRLPGRSIKVYAVADVHIGDPNANVRGFEKFLKKVESEDDSYIVICGDLLNFGIRAASCPTDIYTETLNPMQQIDYAVELLQPIAGKIFGIVGGNHEHRGNKAVGLDPLYSVCSMLRYDGETLQSIYRKNLAFLRVELRGNTHDHYSLLLVHGKSESRMKQFVNCVEGVNAIVHGHTHNGYVNKPARLVFTQQNNVRVEPLVSVCATSWVDYGGYAARSCFKPTATSDPQALLLEYTGTNNRKGQIRVVW